MGHSLRQSCRSASAALALAMAGLTAPSALLAQEAPVFAESFFLLPTGGETDVADMCARSFGRPLTNSGNYVERASAEVTETISTCVTDDMSPEFARDCELAIAQSEVDYVIMTSATQVDGAWLFEVALRSPTMNAGVWSGDAVVTGDTPSLLAREECGRLGDVFLASRSSEPAPQEDPVVAEDPVVEPAPDPIVEVAPDPVDTAVVVDAEPEPANVTVSLSSGRHRFRVNVVDGQGEMHTCRRRLTNSRPCELSNVLSGGGMLTYATMQRSDTTPVSIAAPSTHFNVQHVRQERRNARIMGAGLLGGGFVVTMASLISGATSDGIAFNTGTVLGIVAIVAGEFTLAYGFMGPHVYEVHTY